VRSAVFGCDSGSLTLLAREDILATAPLLGAAVANFD